MSRNLLDDAMLNLIRLSPLDPQKLAAYYVDLQNEGSRNQALGFWRTRINSFTDRASLEQLAAFLQPLNRSVFKRRIPITLRVLPTDGQAEVRDRLAQLFPPPPPVEQCLAGICDIAAEVTRYRSLGQGERYHALIRLRMKTQATAERPWLQNKLEATFPSDLLMPLRVLLRLQGLGLQLGSTVPLDDMLRPYLTQMLADRYKPAALLKQARRTLRSWERLLGPLPDELAGLAVRLRREGAQVDVTAARPRRGDRQAHRRPARLGLDRRRLRAAVAADAADAAGHRRSPASPSRPSPRSPGAGSRSAATRTSRCGTGWSGFISRRF